MTIQSQPVRLAGGSTPDLPYRLDPPLKAGNSRKRSLTDRNFLSYVTKGWVFIALSVWAGLTIYMLDEDWTIASPGSVLFYAFGIWIFSALAIRGTIPSMMFSAVMAFTVFSFNPPGITLILIAVYLASLTAGINKRFFGGSVETSKLSRRAVEHLATLEQSMVPVWGVAGAHIAKSKQFGDLADVGARGEAAVGAALQKVVDAYPFVRVFHGLNFTPDKAGADVDHAVLIGRNLFLIDAKNWRYADYTWSRDGRVLRDLGEFDGGNVHMDNALKLWSQYLGGSVKGMEARIALAKPDTSHRGSYSLANGRSPRGVELTTLTPLVQELMNVAASTEPVVDRRLVYKVASQLQ